MIGRLPRKLKVPSIIVSKMYNPFLATERNDILKQKEKNESKYHRTTSIHEIRSCTDNEISKKNQHVNVLDDTGFSSFYYKKVFMILISHHV